jgi:hypothetical protein
MAMWGVTKEMFEQMKIYQANCCAICLKEFDGLADIHVDHSHDPKAINGMRAFLELLVAC